MLCYDYFKGEDSTEGLMGVLQKIQLQMYEYSLETITTIGQSKYFYNPFASLYIDKINYDIIFKMMSMSFDHRIVQNFHDNIAAVFRYKVTTTEISLGLFDPMTKEEIEQYFMDKHTEASFLDKINDYLECQKPDCFDYAFIKLWDKFLINELEHKKYILPALGRIVRSIVLYIEYQLEELEKDKKWREIWRLSYEAAEIVKKEYFDIPWR